MKPTDKNSPQNKKNKASNDTLLYVLLLILAAILIGSLTWYFWPKEKEWNHEYEKALGKKKTSPTADDVSKLIQGNRSRLKTAKRILADKMRGRKLTDKQKNEVKKELEHINIKGDLTKILQDHKIEEIGKQDPARLASIYSDLYEQGKVTVRLKDKTAVGRPLEELEKQQEIQSRWVIPDQEVEEINTEMKKWIEKWYRQAEAELIGSEPGKYPRLTEYVVPWYENGKKIENPSQEQIDKLKKVQELSLKGGGVKLVDLSKPLEIEFKSYYGFLTEEDKKGSTEAQETYGLTKSTSVNIFGGSQTRDVKVDGDLEPIGSIPSDYNSTKIIDDNYRDISIGFEKNMFFNRLGYEELLTEVEKKDGSVYRQYFDICFEECVGVMAHELAHAIINTFEAKYDGEEGGGHGKLFYGIMKKIKKMIKNSSDFEDFKTWWQKPEKEQKELAIGSILTAEPSNWERWKWWYIGGGAVTIILVVGLVIVFWDGSTDAKKNAKN